MNTLEALRLSNGIVHVEVSRAFGPRVLRYGLVGGENFLADVPDVSVATELGEWKARGGHRLWTAPESMPGSYAPDDRAPSCHADDLMASFSQPTDAAGIGKSLTVSLAPGSSRLTLAHTITNRGYWPIAVASWGITAVRPDAVALIPQPIFQPHGDALLPARPLVQWPFTDLTDPRWVIGAELIRLTPDPLAAQPQKLGVGNQEGWCAAATRQQTFIKRFEWDRCARYPDFGCNNEVYTAGAYLEVEVLGPMKVIAAGETVTHVERWYLFDSPPELLDQHETTQCAALRALVALTH